MGPIGLNVLKQVNNSGGLYRRYIHDIFLAINWPIRHLLKQDNRWNTIDSNIHLSANAGLNTNFFYLYMENKVEKIYTTIYHKPLYEPYYLPFTSVHPLHMKKNIPFTMLLRAIRYCSTFELFIKEREVLRMKLLLNKYSGQFIQDQFNRIFQKFKISQPIAIKNYEIIREEIINTNEGENQNE